MWECGSCKRYFDHVSNLDQHVKICSGGVIKHVWKGGVYEPKKNIKQQLVEFGINVSNHDFLFPYLAVFDTEASLPGSDYQPAAKRVKSCIGLDGNLVERRLKFTTVHRLLSYSIATNVPGCTSKIFECRQDDTEDDIKNLVRKFISHLTEISEKILTP